MTTVIEGASLQDCTRQLVEDIAAQLRTQDFGEFFQGIIPDIERDHEAYFISDVGPDGAAWAPLRPSTIAAKGHADILERTLAMMQSVTGQSHDSIREVSAHELIFGTRDPKAVLHQHGTSRVPARPFVGITPEAVDRIGVQIADYIAHTL